MILRRRTVIARRQRYIDHKLQPISVRNQAKRPLEPDWQKTSGMPTYHDSAQNTGLLCGAPLYPLDIDVKDEQRVAEIIAAAEALFGRTVIRYRKDSAHCLLVYQHQDYGPRKRVVLLSDGDKCEFLGLGQQFVSDGVHPSGALFEWYDRSLDELELEDIPIVGDDAIATFCAWAQMRWPVVETVKPNGANGPGRNGGAKADFRNTCKKEDTDAALKRLPCDYDRETWVKLARSYRAGGGSYEVYRDWSRQHPQYESDAYLEQQWASFEVSHSVTVRTLFAEVFRRFPGWKKPSERGPDYKDPVEDDWEGEFGEGAMPSDPFADLEELPLCPEPRHSEPYPLEALGALQAATEALSELVDCDPALAAQTVLMVACLTVMGIADIELPRIGRTALILYLITVALSSERKSSADRRLLRGVKAFVEQLKATLAAKSLRHANELKVYAAESGMILRSKKLDRAERLKALDALGPEPKPLLKPVLAAHDVTVEGILKAWSKGELWPVQALTTSEGGMFVSGAAMSRDMRMRTVATLCALWDGETITKLRAGDGVMSIGLKRITAHLMIQPNFIPELLGDAVLRQQGFLSRLLIAWPRSRIGYRVNDTENKAAEAVADAFAERVHFLLSKHLHETLELGTLRVEGEAAALWRAYSIEIEIAQRKGAAYADLTDVAGKSAEMAGRIAGVLTLFEKPGAATVPAQTMRNAITLARWYLNEALRIAETGALRPEVGDAQELLAWFQANPERRSRSGALLYGPKRLRSKRALDPVLRILAEHNLIVLSKKGPIQVREAETD